MQYMCYHITPALFTGPYTKPKKLLIQKYYVFRTNFTYSNFTGRNKSIGGAR